MKLQTRGPGYLLAVIVMGLAGCEAAPEAKPVAEFPAEFLRKHWEAQEVPVAHIIRRDYRLREGDQLEIIYHVQHRRNPSYKIKIQDRIVIRFPFNPELSQIEQVQSDGTLHLDLLKEPLEVFDLTIAEVQDKLYKEYSRYIKDPVLTVSFSESNVKIAELKKAISTAPRGQSRLVPITPEGTISLPFIVDIRAAGLTIGELHNKLNQSYRDAELDELEVTVNVQSVAPTRIYVLGEVRIPGVLLNRTGALTAAHEFTLVQALAQAGGYIPGRAELSMVMLVRRRHLARPEAAIVNVFQLLENRKKALGQPVVADDSKHRYDIWLEDGDVVYVPTSKIARRADYIEYVWTRGIRAVTGHSSSVGINYSASEAVNWLGGS